MCVRACVRALVHECILQVQSSAQIGTPDVDVVVDEELELELEVGVDVVVDGEARLSRFAYTALATCCSFE